jgi:hypothetical protein
MKHARIMAGVFLVTVFCYPVRELVISLLVFAVLFVLGVGVLAVAYLIGHVAMELSIWTQKFYSVGKTGARWLARTAFD